MSEFAISDVLPGKLNALVKNLMKQMDITDPNEAVRRVNAGEWILKIANLLGQVATTSVSAWERFVAADHFTEDNRQVQFWLLSDTFTEHFLDKVEENVPSAELAVYRLERDSLDADIRKELTEEREETTLAHFYELLSRQPHGEKGKLHTDGSWIISHIKDAKGTLLAVGTHWRDSRGWDVEANFVASPHWWDAGDQLVSRK